MYKSHDTVFDNEAYTLMYYAPIGDIVDKTPTFIQPPFAGRGGDICQNLIDKCRIGRHVYVFDLKSANPFMQAFHIVDFVKAIDNCQAIVRGTHNVPTLDIVACCQGGWITALHNALNPSLYRKFAIFASPINTRTGEDNIIEDYCKVVQMGLQKLLVDISGGIQPGLCQWFAFSLVDPYATYVQRWFKLWNTAVGGDEQKLQRAISNNIWHDTPYNLGRWFLEAMSEHFVGNKLFEGTWEVAGERVDLGNITCPIFVYSGADDNITHPEQARAILDKISSTEQHYTDFEKAGHTRVFTGPKELDHFAAEFYVESDFKGIRDHLNSLIEVARP